MIALLSPAKRLDFDREGSSLPATSPALLGDTRRLARRARELAASELMKLMGISRSLAELNHKRFDDFKLSGAATGTPSIFAFRGDTYQGFDVDSLDERTLKFAQEHVCILSGLYGLLRPLDLIQPYRLEMGSKLQTERGNNLYDFWGDRITELINRRTKSSKTPIVNLASTEYFSAVKPRLLKGTLVDCVFKEVKGGQAKVVGFSAKRARGMMARFICLERLRAAKELESFNLGGYVFQPKLSSETHKEFHRKS